METFFKTLQLMQQLESLINGDCRVVFSTHNDMFPESLAITVHWSDDFHFRQFFPRKDLSHSNMGEEIFCLFFAKSANNQYEQHILEQRLKSI